MSEKTPFFVDVFTYLFYGPEVSTVNYVISLLFIKIVSSNFNGI